MSNVKIQQVSPEQGWIVGFSIVANPVITDTKPAVITDKQGDTEVPLVFYQGDLNLIRSHLQKAVDDAINALMDM